MRKPRLYAHAAWPRSRVAPCWCSRRPRVAPCRIQQDVQSRPPAQPSFRPYELCSEASAAEPEGRLERQALGTRLAPCGSGDGAGRRPVGMRRSHTNVGYVSCVEGMLDDSQQTRGCTVCLSGLGTRTAPGQRALRTRQITISCALYEKRQRAILYTRSRR